MSQYDGYNYLFRTYHNETNQQLFGQLTVYLKGYSIEQNLEDLINGIKTEGFPYQWDNAVMKFIAKEYSYFITEGEHSDNWNGEAASWLNTSAFQLISDWSTTTTITAGVLDTIDYYTNYNFLSWSSPIGLPNTIMKNIEAVEVVMGAPFIMGIGAGAIAVVGGGAGDIALKVVAGAGAMGLFLGSWLETGVGIELGIGAGVVLRQGLGLEIGEKLGVQILTIITPGVVGLGVIIESSIRSSIKSIFTSNSYQIENLINKDNPEIKDKLLHSKNIQDDGIYIENLTDNSLEQAKENSASIDNHVGFNGSSSPKATESCINRAL